MTDSSFPRARRQRAPGAAGVLLASLLVASSGVAFAQSDPAAQPQRMPWDPQPLQPIQPGPSPSAPGSSPPPPPSPAPSEAASPSAPAPAPPSFGPRVREERQWYGWETLIADAAALGLLVGGLGSDAPGLLTASGVTYLFASPVIHFTHGNVGRGFGALGLRLGGPPLVGLTGLVVGAIAGSSGKNSGDVIAGASGGAGVGLAVGLVAGYALAVVLDVAVFSYEKVKVQDGQDGQGRAARLGSRRGCALAPTVDVGSHHGVVGLGATF